MPLPVSVGEFRTFCELNSLPDDVTSLDPHKAFITAHEVSEESVYVMITTRYLTSISASAECVQMDATFNVMWESYPLIVIGSQDKNRKLHVTSLHIVSTNEGTAVYTKVYS